ncbi:type II secretion system F family protein [Candidatus Woesearchaeota archaeon]|nr:type II secretion system F family protein [Candidatus Woesearchaeota archaeon]
MKAFNSASMFAGVIGALLFLFLNQLEQPVVLAFIVAIFVFFGMLWFMLESPRVYKNKRQKEIDREVLFAGRYILIKMRSGVPLLNSMIDASGSYGVGGIFFKEIVDDVYAGMPLETAIENARDTSASRRFNLILSEILVSLKTGVDITSSLQSVIDEIAKEQLLEIQEYSKKLGGIVMMYMVVGIVVPSLGLTLFTVMASFINIDFQKIEVMAGIGVIIMFIQFMFVQIIKSQRPNVNI